jgi:dTDP-4-amino-4,6-dideoxygalactose transaminase
MFNIRRSDIDELKEFGLVFDAPWQVVDHFENLVADFFGAPYAVAVDSCTHGIELCLRLLPQEKVVTVPAHTYMSVPMTLEILNIPYVLTDEKWNESYQLSPYSIIDAATMWRRNSYQKQTYTVISFQFQKHIAIGRGGMILLDDYNHYRMLQCMVRDGRDRTLTQNNDNVKTLGFHYYMTPEDAARGIKIFYNIKDANYTPKGWQHYTDLRKKDFFNGK